MYCIDTKALVFMFNGGTPYGFTIHPIFTRIKVLLLVYTNHTNNEKHVHHGFLAHRFYLCSTSLDLETYKTKKPPPLREGPKNGFHTLCSHKYGIIIH